MKHLKKHTQATVSMTVNGKPVSAVCDSRTTLLDFLRSSLFLNGTHAGCEHGICGACTVMIDGAPARACLGLAHQYDGAEITTVEGLAKTAELNDLQMAFSRHHALQCGFCTPGFLIVAEDLLRRIPNPTKEQIREEISGNLCRCTGYVGIVNAIQEVSQMRLKRSAQESDRV